MSDESTANPERRTEPESLRLRDISPSLTVDDLEASLAWYRDVLGCHVKETWERDGRTVGAYLLAGASSIMLNQDDGAKGRDRKKGEGFRLYLTTVQDVDSLAEAFVARGGALESPPADTPWGSRAFSVVDPDGFSLTIASG
ncbi:MAG: VOC family protein [Gemmatimonadota bacterium]|jgi:uncharacterized glyoxalase superfamily protein PhnB